MQETKLSKINMLRGLFCLEIIFGHVVRYEAGPIFLFGKFMICSVAFFFFVSGYGMTVSAQRKESYLNRKYWINKPLYLLILPAMVFILECVIDLCFGKIAEYYPNGSRPFFQWYFFKTNWYLWELIVFYILFWLIFKFVGKNRFVWMFAISLTAIIVMYLCGLHEAWIASALGFPFGVLWGEHEEACNNFFRSAKGIMLTVILAVFGVFPLFLHSEQSESMLTVVFMRNAICIVTIIIASYLCEWKLLRDNVVSRFLTKNSTSLYLSQFIWLKISEQFGWNWGVRLLFALSTTVATALLIVEPMKNLTRYICNRISALIETKQEQI